jgi:hypothetical protein
VELWVFGFTTHFGPDADPIRTVDFPTIFKVLLALLNPRQLAEQAERERAKFNHMIFTTSHQIRAQTTLESLLSISNFLPSHPPCYFSAKSKADINFAR